MTDSSRHTLAARLLRSHLLVAALGLLPLAIGLGVTVWLQTHARELADTKAPRAVAAGRAYAGLQRSTSALRGWKALDDPSFRTERIAAWDDDVWPAVELLSAGLDADDAAHQEITDLRRTLAELEEWQFWIEDVAQTPGNEPARDRLAQDVDPLARVIAQRIERALGSARAANGGKAHTELHELRVAFESSRTTLSRHTFDGNPQDAANFTVQLDDAARHLKDARLADTISGEDHDFLAAELSIYREYATRCIADRRAPTWNRARHMLEVEAVPLAAKAATALRALADRESREMRDEADAVKQISSIAYTVGLVLALLMFLVAFIVSRRSGERITAPVVRLTRVAERLRAGEQVEDVVVEADDEIGSLATTFNQMRAALEAKEREFRLAVEASPAGILMVSDDGTILLVNQRIEQLFGYTRDELLGEPVHKLLPPALSAQHADHLQTFFTAPGQREMGPHRELSGQRADGSLFPIEVALNPIERPEGRAVLASVADVTAHREFANQIRAARDAAEHSNRAKSEFLANMSHELRTPLNSIIGFSKILLKNKNGALEERQLSHLQRVHKNGVHLLGLVNDVLDLSKIEAGQLEYIIEVVDVRELVDGVVAELQGRAATAEISLQTVLPDGALVALLDPMRMKQVLINLVGNALKFTDEGGVTVHVIVDADTARPAAIEVRDTGIGIPADKLEHVFGAFQQADASTSREYGGTGLGLAISRRLCANMGCAIEVESVVGKGSTFRIALGPATFASAAESEAPTTEPPTESPAPTVDGRRRVLVIDDDEDSRLLVADAFEAIGWNIEFATGGADGLARARARRPHLVTVDLMMPAMSGWEFIKTLRRDEALRDLPVIVISHVADTWRAALAHDIAAMQKPIDANQLAAVLERAALPAAARVLVVDDDPDIRALLRMILTDSGYEVDEAENGGVALDRMTARPPDLVLLDLLMPEVDGFEFLNRISNRERLSNIPIIVVTGKELDVSDRERLGRVDVVAKSDELDADLQRALQILASAQDTTLGS